MESGKSSSWPWRKKSTPTNTHVATASQKKGTETGTPSGIPNYGRRSQSSLSETLLTDNINLLQQQHAHIAEEAVSGRQKAEEMWMAMEAKMGEAEQQLIAAEAEKSVALASLQQRDASLALLTQGKEKAEAQLHSLYANMTALLKENSRLKYELHLLNKEHHIRSGATPAFHLNSSPASGKLHHHDPQLGGDVDGVHSYKGKVFDTLESELQVLREVEANAGDGDGDADADDVSCAQSLASAMIAELDHFRRDKALMLFEDQLTEIESVASSSHPNTGTSLKQEIEIQAADRKNWRPMYATSDTASKYCTSIGEIVKLVKALAHPLLYSTTIRNKSFADNKFNVPSGSELSESDLQLNIEKLEAMKEKAGASVSSLAVVEFLEVLVGVLNRLVKITLYRNAQRDGCSDDCDDDQDDDLTRFASISQKINSASFNNFLSPLPNIPSKVDFSRETIRHDRLPTKIEGSENEQVKNWEKQGMVGGHGHPSLNSKHLVSTPTNSNSSSSSSKLFHFNSNYIKTAIRSTVSKTRTQSSVTAPSYPHIKSKPPNKLLNRLLSFS